MKKILTTERKREIASEFAQLISELIEQDDSFARHMDERKKCQKENKACCYQCPKLCECPHEATTRSHLHKTEQIRNKLSTFAWQYAWYILYLLDARYCDASQGFDALVQKNIEQLGYLPQEKKEFLKNIGCGKQYIK